ncbi:type I restriction endonuclease subunit R [Nostoc sp. UIC 10607]|uniref:type I restriction endonuclease subunit R n=1 Tax=Nostoc sp. UIC 10607 TaxID=3045935 RepID=UPI0039A134CD
MNDCAPAAPLPMSTEYSEDRLVQKTTADFFEQELQWHSVYAYDTEIFGPTGTLGRKDDREVLLFRYLRQALEELNPGHPLTAYDDAIGQLATFTSSKTLLQINQEKYKLIRDGIRVSYRTPQGETKEPILKVIDFDQPERNHFLVVRELCIKGPLYDKRPDIVGFVNGIPLLFIELKRSNRDVQVAYESNYTAYRNSIPELFHYNAMVMLSNGIDAKVGSITSPFDFFHEWRRLLEEEKGRVHFETMLRGICTKKNFLDIVENFIVFDDSSGATYKILGRNHQYLGVNRAFTAIQDRKVREGKLGVFWHTQGSGKSYSMGFLSEKVHRKLPGNFTFLIVTDREELDDQIVRTFAGIEAVRDDSTQAVSGDNLIALLKGNPRYVFTLIHKFNKEGQHYSDRDDIIVVCDEAHRSQYGMLAENMRKGLPNASFIAFTGTPLMASAEDQKTRDVFGDYVSTYDFQRAVEDGATVPLFYDNRGEKLFYVDDDQQKQVATPSELNERIAAEVSRFDLHEEDERRLMRRLGSDYPILTAEKRLDRIAEDLVAHYTTRWQTGKAMMVCLDKLTTVRMWHLIDKHWKNAIARQEERVRQAIDRQDQLEQQHHLTWLIETEYIVVVSEDGDEVKFFEDYGLDIRPHRAKIKNRDLETEFKNSKHPFRLALVCAMWLTGFDVPTLATLYMDKPMKGHTLMQTIARANRVAEGKNNGLLVDYNSILKSLQAALAQYARADGGSEGGDDGKAPYKDLDKLRDDYVAALQDCINHLASLGFDLQQLIDAEGFDKLALLDKENEDSALNAVCKNDESRARFEVMAREVVKKKQALVSESKLTQPYQPQYNAIQAIYQQLNQKRELSHDLNAVLRSLYDVIGNAITVSEAHEPGADSGKLYNISEINWDLLQAEFSQSKTKNVQVQTLKEGVDQQLRRMIRQNPSRINFYNRYQAIMEEYNQETEQVTIEKTFEDLLNLVKDLSEEDSRAVREGLNEEYLAVFDLLCEKKESLNAQARNRVKKVAQDLIEALKAELQKLENWKEKQTTQAQVKTFIYNYLYSDDTGLPVDAYDDTEVTDLSNVVFLHVYQQYESAQRNPYTGVA